MPTFVTRIPALVFLAAAAAACGSGRLPTGPAAAVAGTYVLAPVQPPPVVSGQPESGSLVLTAAGSAVRTVGYGSGPAFTEFSYFGTFTVQDSTVSLTLTGAGMTPASPLRLAARIESDGSLVITYSGPADGQIVETWRRQSLPTASEASTLDGIVAQFAAWSALGITHYAFVYRQSGFFLCCSEGLAIALQVRNDSVLSAAPASGGPCPSPGCFTATVDGLFGTAIAAAQAGNLGHVTFDPALHYPTAIAITGPPDASGTDSARGLARLP